ncbi:MAG: hypothetical protein CFE45_14685 [Burkholderiales bacterium PBB5]|nr:MAG: hypothetical protein CFE45_14685 [Burkholderiales bacterium PBB5]
MKIAFASCMSSTVFKQQPVWDQIAAQKPDRLVLLGDSIYLDVPWADGNVHPKTLGTGDFLTHGWKRWAAQVNHPAFRALVQQVPTDAIWDDHDFLWDESYKEGAVNDRRYTDLVKVSDALFNAFRAALAAGLKTADDFPTSISDWRLNQLTAQPPGYQLRHLAPDVKLHLTDGRSWRIRQQMLGAAQRTQIEQAMAQAPDALHLLASGSVVRGNDDAQWQGFDDHVWLLGLARQYRILVLSGDIHRNRFDSIDLGGGRWLFDATSSGAAVYALVSTGEAEQNYGVVDISPTTVALSFYRFGTPDPKVPARLIDRGAWRLR